MVLENVKLARVEEPDLTRIKEADLAGHLGGEKSEGESEGDSEEPVDLAREDYALYEALNLLKGLSILQRRNS